MNSLQARLVMLYRLDTPNKESENQGKDEEALNKASSVIGLKVNSLKGFQLSWCNQVTPDFAYKMMGRVAVYDVAPRMLGDFGV